MTPANPIAIRLRARQPAREFHERGRWK